MNRKDERSFYNFIVEWDGEHGYFYCIDAMADEQINALEAEQEQKEEENTMENIITRPIAPHWYGKLGKAPKTFYNAYYLAAWAYDLAAHNGEQVTETRYNIAVTLLNAVNRYACADARQWERSNTSERYANSAQCERDEKALDERRAKLQKRLAVFGAHLENNGLYPTIADANNNRICHYSND